MHPATLLDCLEITTGADPGASVIWLHGLGADASDFEPIVDELDLAGVGPLRFVFPNAPMRAVTINGGYVMRAWYDILSADFSSRRVDPVGILESAAQITALMARENERGVPDERIVLAGFSQGGAIALHTALRHPRTLAGVLALSTYLPLADTLAAEAQAANARTPIFMAHGEFDAVIGIDLAQQSAEQLRAADYPLEWHAYAMEHSVCMEEVRDIGAWLRRVLK